MAPAPSLVLDESVFYTLIVQPQRERRRLIAILQGLKNASEYEAPSDTVRDASNRELRIKTARPYLITYWLDSPVNELRIIDIQRVRF
jgi:hypothetical protein